MFFATGRLRRRVGQEGSAPQVGLQVLQVVPGQRLPGTVHTRGGGRFRGGESGYENATSTALCFTCRNWEAKPVLWIKYTKVKKNNLAK